MKGAIDEGKEISPMFPRLHVKDAEKGGPKAPPRNKMALYEQLSIPSQSFSSGSASLLPLPLRNCTIPSLSSHVGSNQSIQFCTSNAPSILAEQIQEYNSRKIDLTKLMQGNFINGKNSLKTLHGEDAFITSGSGHGKNSCCGLIQNDKDEDKLADCNPSCSLKSLNPFRKKVNSLEIIELKSTQYGKNQMEEHSEASQIGQKPKEGSVLQLDGFGDMTNASLISLARGRDSKPLKNESRSLKDEIESISAESLKTLQGSNGQTHKEHEALGDTINLRDHCMEKPSAIDVHKCTDELEIGQMCFLSRRNMNKDEERYRHFDALNKPSSECLLSMDVSPENVLKVIGEKQFWKARRTIINQQKIFIVQVFELHRLIEVQRIIAGSPHLLLEDNSLLLSKTPLKPSAFKKLHSDYLAERSPLVKPESKSEKPAAAHHAKSNAICKIPPPCVSSMSKGLVNQLPNYGYHLGNPALTPLDINTKHPPSCVYPLPPGNQWLVPVMSPSEGLVYKPMMGPCPPNAGFMPPLYGTMSFNPGSKDVPDAALAPSSHQRIGVLSGSSLHNFLPPLMHPSISASSLEQIGQSSNGHENHHHQSAGEANSAVLYRSSSKISLSQKSQIMSTNVTSFHHHSSKDQELQQRSTASSPCKRMKGDVLPLFPLAPTFWPSTTDRNNTNVDDDHQPRVIKAMPHNPKSATESAARIFRSIQEERKHS